MFINILLKNLNPKEKKEKKKEKKNKVKKIIKNIYMKFALKRKIGSFFVVVAK